MKPEARSPALPNLGNSQGHELVAITSLRRQDRCRTAALRSSLISSGGAVYPRLPLTNPSEPLVEERSSTSGFVTAVVFATCFPVIAAQMFAHSSRSASVTSIAVQQVTAVALLYVSALLASLIASGPTTTKHPRAFRSHLTVLGPVIVTGPTDTPESSEGPLRSSFTARRNIAHRKAFS